MMLASPQESGWLMLLWGNCLLRNGRISHYNIWVCPERTGESFSTRDRICADRFRYGVFNRGSLFIQNGVIASRGDTCVLVPSQWRGKNEKKTHHWTNGNSELKCLFWSADSIWSKLKYLSLHVYKSLNRGLQRNGERKTVWGVRLTKKNLTFHYP